MNLSLEEINKEKRENAKERQRKSRGLKKESKIKYNCILVN